MNITAALPARATQAPARREPTPSDNTPSQPQDSFFSEHRELTGAALGAGIGILAGSFTGVLPAIGGAAAGFAGGAIIGGAGTAFVTSRLGWEDGPAKLALPAAIVGCLVGAAGGGFVGATMAGPIPAVALGAAGALGGAAWALGTRWSS